MIEIVGILASIMVLISFLFTNQRKIREINIVGALLFVFYGIVINAFSVWFLNGILVVVHMYYLIEA